MKRKSVNTLYIFVLVTVLAAGALAGCGGDSTSTTEGSEAASETTAAPETTQAPATTQAPETTAAPETTEAPAPEAAPITITDAYGREHTFDQPAERIVMLGAEPALAAIKSIGAEDKVVAVEEFITGMGLIFPELSQLPTIGTGEAPDYEAILQMQPDAVVAYSYVPPEAEEMLEPEVPVLRFDLGTQSTYSYDIAQLGLLLDREGEAAEFIAWTESYIDVITERVAGLSEDEKPRVFGFYGGDWGMSDGPPYGTYGSEDYLVTPLFEMAGGINIAGELPGAWITVDPEWVLTENPSIIIREVYPYFTGHIIGYEAEDASGSEALQADLLSKPEFAGSDAASEDQVYIILGNFLQADWFIGLPYLATMFHPELFSDIDPEAVHQEYLSRFQRLDYDLSEQGLFLYPDS